MLLTTVCDYIVNLSYLERCILTAMNAQHKLNVEHSGTDYTRGIINFLLSCVKHHITHHVSIHALWY